MSPVLRRLVLLGCALLLLGGAAVPSLAATGRAHTVRSAQATGKKAGAKAKAKSKRKARHKAKHKAKRRRSVRRPRPKRRTPAPVRPVTLPAPAAVPATALAPPVVPAAPEATEEQAAGPAPDPAAPAPDPVGRFAAVAPDGFFGINLGLEVVQQSDAALDAHLRRIATAGIAEVRTDASWAAVETTAPSAGVHHYDWSYPDRIAAAIAQAGLRWYPTLGYSPPWASSDPSATYPYNQPPAPEHLDDFAAYVAAFARRYGRGGSFWAQHPALAAPPVQSYELWNEPNLRDDFGWTPTRLADLYHRTAPLVHAIDPQARVIPAALDATASGTTHEAEAYAAAVPDADALGIHLYVFSTDYLESRIVAVRHALPAKVPLDVNEVSWTVSGDGGWPVTPAQRDANLQAIASRWPRLGCGIARLMPFAYVTTTTPMTDAELAADSDPYAGYGLWRPDGTPTSGAGAYTAAIALETGRGPSAPDTKPLHLC